MNSTLKESSLTLNLPVAFMNSNQSSIYNSCKQMISNQELDLELKCSTVCKYPTTPLLTTANTRKRVVCNEIEPSDLKLLKVIGRGTFAQQVALAKHQVTANLYAIKSLDKKNLVARKQVLHTLTEKKVLQQLNGHPFIVKLFRAFQTESDLHFVLEYCQGGELFYHLQQRQCFTEKEVLFYGAEVLTALHTLHQNGVVYRDLKPENVLLDSQGHIRLADFGFAKDEMGMGARTFSFCGSPEYLSPEMVLRQGHTLATDMWSYGCFLYELLVGKPPFQNDKLSQLFLDIRIGRVYYPSALSPVVVSLLRGLLSVDMETRFTTKKAMNHPFFQSMDWKLVMNRGIVPPFIPIIRGSECTSNFDADFTSEQPVGAIVDTFTKRSKQQCEKEELDNNDPIELDVFIDF